MPRKKLANPSYRLHVSGQARVTLDGNEYYLGTHESPESWAKYHALLQQYHANGMKMPKDSPRHRTEITVRCVTAEFRQHIPERYAENKTHASRYERLCRILEERWGDLAAKEFGPRRLRKLRETFIEDGLCRNYINEQIRSVVFIFKHAVSCELVDVGVHQRLHTLEPLKEGQTSARESEPVMPVEMADVLATAKHLSPILRDMVLLQRATGMRPGELCQLRPCDVEKLEDGNWIYRPPNHKNRKRGKTRTIPIIGDDRIILGPYLENRDSEQFCFSPQEVVALQRQERREERTTPDSCGNRPGTNRKRKPRRQPGEKYTSGSYRRAIQRAAELAQVPKWSPYQLRHAAITEVREALGLEEAQAFGGHARADMTEHYARLTDRNAIEAAVKMQEARYANGTQLPASA